MVIRPRSIGLPGALSDETLPVRLLLLRMSVGAQPQRDVDGLQRLLDNPRKIFVQGLQIRLFTKPGRELFQGLPRVVLASVEAAIYERLDTAPQRVEERGDC
jgi:hypothetical protein